MVGVRISVELIKFYIAMRIMDDSIPVESVENK